EPLTKLGRHDPPIVDPDLLRSQAPGMRFAVIDPPGDADVEHMTGPLSITDRDDRLSAHASGKAELPCRLAASVTLDEQVMLSGEVFQRGGDRAECVDDFGGHGRQSSRRRHGAIVELSPWIRGRPMSCRRSSRRRARLRLWASAPIRGGPAMAWLVTCSGWVIASSRSILMSTRFSANGLIGRYVMSGSRSMSSMSFDARNSWARSWTTRSQSRPALYGCRTGWSTKGRPSGPAWQASMSSWMTA